jgi:hypothetical protein
LMSLKIARVAQVKDKGFLGSFLIIAGGIEVFFVLLVCPICTRS